MQLNHKLSQMYAKLLSQKNFLHNHEAKQDGQIIEILLENYENPNKRKKEIQDWLLDEELNFPLHNVYIHKTEKKILIAYRGTDFTNLKDIISDIQIILGTNAIDIRVEESFDFFDQVNVKYPYHTKRVTGHSLGGTISLLIAKHRKPDRVIVFNPGSAPTRSFLGMMQDTLFKKARTTTITTYKILGDIVSTLSFIGNTKTFILETPDPQKLHSITSFKTFFSC